MKRLQELQEQSEAMEDDLLSPDEDYILREEALSRSFDKR